MSVWHRFSGRARLHRRRRNSQVALSLLLLSALLVSFWAPAAPASAREADPARSPARPNRQPVAGAAPNAPALAVTKTLVSPTGRTTLFAGETAVFELRVENTGTTTVAYIPQLDEFGTNCLEFLPKADPPESDYSNLAGYVDWNDLTVSNGVDLAPGQAFVTQVSFLVKAPTSGNSEPGYNTVRVSGALDANGDPVPDAGDTFQFVCATRPTLVVDKSFVTPQNRTVLLTGETVQFQVVVTNTGQTTLAYIPLLDLFDTACLEFVPKASPPESTEYPGIIEWEDLTLSNGADLPPGQAFTTTMTFQVVGPPSPAVTASGVNTATVSGALDVNGYPAPDGQDSVQFTCAAPASIGDYVWLDLNGNGLQDEPPGSGLNGVTVFLYLDDGDGVFEPGTDDVLVATTVTAGDGGYLFDMLHAGSYWVDVDETTLPSDLTLTAGTDPLLVTVAYGDAYLDADFGYTGADVSIVKTDTFDPVAVGGVLTYTLTIHNAGPTDALNVIVTDTLPVGLTFVAAQPPQTSGPNPLVWNLGTLSVGAQQTIVVTTTVNVAASGTVVNQAQVASTTPDPDPDNNQAEEPTALVRPAIAIQKTANPAVTLPGGGVLYTYLVTNPGDVPLAEVTVADDKCAPVTGPDPAGDVNNNSLLDPGEVWVYTCTALVSEDTTNTATATGQPSDDQGRPLPGIGPVAADDTAFVDVVNPAIQIVKTADPTTVYAGEQVIYTYAVTNPGDVPLANVTVTDNQCSPVLYQGGDDNGNGLLDVDETWTYTCTAVVTEDTLNTAVATGQPADDQGQPLPGIGPVRDQDTAYVDVINPAIRIIKTPSAAQVAPGTLVTYTYAVTNVGDAPLTGVVVTDNKCAPVSGPAPGGDVNNNGLLDPGETWVYQCSAILNDDTTNVATVTARDPLGSPVVDDDKVFVDVVRAGLQVDKSADVTLIYAGGTVVYVYTVTNTSNDPIYQVSVSDDSCSPVIYLGGDVNTDTVLDPGETWLYQCTAVLSQDTVNVVTATGQDALGNRVSDGASASVDVINPAINVVKSANPPVVLSGDAVLYTYLVTNPGDDPLSNVTVADDTCSPVLYQSGDANGNGLLDPGETWRFACVANVFEDTTNTATATGNDSLDNPVRDTDTAFVDVVRPAIDLVKTANPTVVLPGGLVLYTYAVTNPGDVPLANVNVSDDKCVPVLYQGGDVNGNGLLDTNETWTFTCIAAVSQDTTNTAVARGQPSNPQGQPLPGIPPVEADDTAFVDVVDPAIQIVKTADPTTVYAGDSVTYTYLVTNPGDVPLANVTVTDDRCSPVTPVTSGGFNAGDANQNGLLDPGESWRYTCATTLSVDTVNTALATGQPTDPTGQPLPGIGPVRDQDTAYVDVINPAIRIVKTPSAAQVAPGTPVTYIYAVTNVGDAPLANVVVADDKCAPVSGPDPAGDVNSNGLLDPGETWVYQCSATLDEDTVNVATVTADDPLDNPVSEDDKAFVDVLRPGLQVDKAANATVVYADTSVLYTYTVTNTGEDPAYNLQVSDDQCSPLVYQSGDVNDNGALDPGEVWIYTCSAILTVDTVNIATVTGEDELGNPLPPDQAAAAVDVINPAINVVKNASPTVILPGGQVVYTYVVTNPGDDPLRDVTVSDDTCSPVTGPNPAGDVNNNGLLDPGETWVYTCTANPTEDTTNTATATGYDSLGNPVRDTDTAFVDVVRPAIAIEKTANPTVVLPGGLVVYTYVVTNPGDVPLVGVTVSDDKCLPVLYQGGDVNGNGLLDTNETWTFTCKTTVFVDTENTANAVGQPADPNGFPLPGIPPVSDQDTAFVDVVNPAIQIVKTADPTLIHSGDSVTYTYLVTNPGDVPLANVTVTDNRCSPVTAVTSGGFNAGDTNQNGLLDPGEAWQYTCTTTLSVDTVNTALATGQPTDPAGQPLPGIGPVQDYDIAFVDVLNPGIRVVKTGPAVSFVGATVTFTYTVTNAGDTPLANVTVTDDVCGSATYVSGDVNSDGLLGLAETWVFTCTYTIQETDPDPLVNVATATGQDALGLQVTDEDTWQTDLVTVSFGDFVWLDTNGDGVQQPGETTGFTGVPVHVTGVDALGNTVNFTVTTTAGYYLVTGLLPGTYTATVPSTFNAYVLSTPASITFTLTETAPQRLDIDFGYSYPTAVTLVSFEAWSAAAAVELRWEVLLPDDNPAPGFHVWRAEGKGDWQQLTATLVTAHTREGANAAYAYTDNSVLAGRVYRYEVRSTTGERFGPRLVVVGGRAHTVFLPLVVR